MWLILALLGSLSQLVSGRTFTIQNLCSFPVYPALFTSGGPAPAAFGQELASCSSTSLTIENSWSGRFWGRTGCAANGTCATGTCGGGLVCTGTGQTPVTLAEFTLNAGGNVQDFYDVSIVDGANLPLAITPSASSCRQIACAADLLTNCPSALIQRDASGSIVGCKSSCVANLDGTPSNSPNCCSGQYDTPQTCPSSGVADYSYFKSQCPDAYAYAYDDSTSLFTCPISADSEYTISFCPSSSCSDGLAVPSGNGTISVASATSSASASRSSASNGASSSAAATTSVKSAASRGTVTSVMVSMLLLMVTGLLSRALR